MLCEHLQPLEKALLASGARETFRGQAWSARTREWVYFEVVLSIATIRRRFALADCVRLHENTDPRTGLERGLECVSCQDAIMGSIKGAPRWPPRA